MGQFAVCGIVWLALSFSNLWADGRVRFLKRQDPSFDPYTNAPSPTRQQWMRDHFWRMMQYSPYFDAKLSWYPGGLVYFDLYAIYVGSSLAAEHPEWILRDAAGNRLYIPWGCGNGTCPQFAADVSNPAFRRWWLDEARRLLAKGYKGLWVDDVNMQFRVGNNNGVEVPPVDPNTRNTMTWDNWRKYIAEFVEQIRAEFPAAEILHNSIWFAGPAGVRDADPYIQRQLAAADYINVEGGVNDDGLTGGNGEWSLNAVLSFVDRLHARGKGAIIDDFRNTPTGREYALACYFLIVTSKDGLGNQSMTPDNWWSGYDTYLGPPAGARAPWNGLLRRDFQGGMVLVNEPGSPTRTVTPPGSFRRVDGTPVSTVRLNAREGVVLLGTVTATDMAPPQLMNIAVSSITTAAATVTYNTNEVADTQVEYGLTTALGAASPLDPTPVMSHRMTIGGLAPLTTYCYRVRSRDAAGNLAVSATATFTTAPAPDTTPPSVTAWSPVSQTTSALITAPVTVTFSKAINAATISTSTVTLFRTGAVTPVPAMVRYETSTRTVRLTPTQSLLQGTTYTATLKGGSSGIKDTAGNALPSDVTWTFQTAAAVLSTHYVSDLAWTQAGNGWGPVERDRSNGETGSSDGNPMRLKGVVYAKGLGVHANSDVRFGLGGACSTFQADIGLDDETGGGGSVQFQVIGDGSVLFASGILTAVSAAVPVNVDVTGRNELRLVVSDGGNGNGLDHADWANARLRCGGTPFATVLAQTSYLSDMTWTHAVNGWGPVERDRSNGEAAAGDGNPMRMKGFTYAKGLGVHATSDVRFNIGGRCNTFQAEVGVDQEAGNRGSVVFEVWLDGMLVRKAGILRGSGFTDAVKVEIMNRNELRLVVTDAGDGIGVDHANWANARITCQP